MKKFMGTHGNDWLVHKPTKKNESDSIVENLQIVGFTQDKYRRIIPVATVMYHPQRPKEEENNANMIAAAPNLYDALLTAKETIKHLHGDEVWDLYQNSPEMKKINFALKKALGENI